MMRIPGFLCTVACTATVLAPLVQTARAFQGATAIYSTIQTSPTSLVPGLQAIRFSTLRRPYRSPDGNRWALGADTNWILSEDDVVVAGAGAFGSVAVQEGAFLYGQGEKFGPVDRNLSLSNDGSFCFATATTNVVDTEIIACRDSIGAISVAARKLEPAPGIPGAQLGNTLNSPSLTSLGVGFVSTALVGVPSTSDAAVFFGGTVRLQKGVTTPAGQLDGGSRTWSSFRTENTYFSADGGNYLTLGVLSGSLQTDAIAVNNHVVVQSTFIVPGSGFVSSVAAGGLQAVMMSNGDWFARGTNTDTLDWVLKNGVVLAVTNNLVPGGLPGERFSQSILSTTFFNMAGNNHGDFVFGAATNNPDANRDLVLVWNNTSVIARQFDPVDLNANGLFDDDVFINAFRTDDMFVTDDDYVYFLADLVNAAGSSLGQGFMRIHVPEPATIGLIGLSAAALLRRRR